MATEWSGSKSAIVGSMRPVGLPLQPPKTVQKTWKTPAEVHLATRGKLPDLKHIQLKSEESREIDWGRRDGKVGRKESRRRLRRWGATPLSLLSRLLRSLSVVASSEKDAFPLPLPAIVLPAGAAGFEPTPPGAAEEEAPSAPADGSLSWGRAGDRWPAGAKLPCTRLRMLCIDRAPQLRRPRPSVLGLLGNRCVRAPIGRLSGRGQPVSAARGLAPGAGRCRRPLTFPGRAAGTAAEELY